MTSPVATLKNRDVSYIDALLLDTLGRLKVVPSTTFQGIPHDDIRVWCHKHAIYGLVTTELVDWLKDRIGQRSAIEIGSGNGCLGRALDIPHTDSYIQADPAIQALYAMQGQPTVTYGKSVEKLEAIDAVRKYRPQVVVGMWVTQYVAPEDPLPVGGGSIYGIKEREILRSPGLEEYIVVGSHSVHGTKDILLNPPTGWSCKLFKPPGLRSRAADPMGNTIYVFTKGSSGSDMNRVDGGGENS
jgi:hypothetical protein